ncbi:SAM-dependent methyltransferase [Streptomyces sp. AJS327]|uniref:SAM-dependent methyltransferase n=1 Tax=Streptomyces sp. AJS327 TaxID=2545265 RepID=UPI0015DE18EA|nr:SAM-dependent methyltransferase [Streptomyces sp. AJS327]MBA0052037.1 SAM-dependent methyltransferase [Streptomyces sp. AJS327]
MSSEQRSDTWDIVSGAGVTALAVAAGRANESARPDALMTDPYAADFLTAASPDLPVPITPDGAEGTISDELWTAISRYLGVRSRVFDDFLTDAAREGVRQFVILASGLDTRPFRLTWPAGTRCFELDQPRVLDFKLGVLRERGAEAACDHTPVPMDLREDWATALIDAGFDTTRPTGWLAEGLLPYLPSEAEEELFRQIDRLSAPGSRIAAECAAVAPLAGDEEIRESGTALGIDLPTLLPDGERRGLREQLTSLGWRYESRTAQESAQTLGRVLPPDPRVTENVSHAFAQRP